MNKLFPLMSAVVLAGCAGAQSEPVKYQPVGMANPAAVYCHEKGGTSVRVQTAQGERADCVLPGGERIDEWDLYRRDHK